MTDEWQQEISDRIKRLKLSLEVIQRERMPGPGPERKKVESLVTEVNKLLRGVEEDKSKGVHNFTYAQRLISRAEENLLAIRGPIAKSSD